MSGRPGRPGGRSRARVVARAAGRFGPLRVVDAEGSRQLSCAGRLQGAACLHPTATIDGRRVVPGPVPDAPYQLAWLLAAAAAPRGRFLMTGLGCGSGACALLHHFPRAAITIAEPDPAVTRLALAHFPLLAHHCARGACRIVASVAAALAGGARWDAILLDAYAGAAGLVCPPRQLRMLRCRADACWVNVADAGGVRVRAMLGRLARAGWPAVTACPVRFSDGGYAGNVVLATVPPPAGARALVPFSGSRHPAAARARREFALLREGGFVPV